MKIDCFFSIFKDDKVEIILNNLMKSKFYKENNEIKLIIACCKNDSINKKVIQKFIKKVDIEIIEMEENFTYNMAFVNACKIFNGDIILLGDSKISRNDIIFERCLEKYNKGANIVHIVKKRKGFKNFIFKILSNIYNFFIKIFTGKKDRLNIISLGLIEKNVIDILKEIPNKACFLKNTKDIRGFETRTVYVDEKTISYKTSKDNKVKAKKPVLYVTVALLVLTLLVVILNCFLKGITVVNIVIITAILLCLILIAFLLPKYFFDIRNKI